MSVINVYNYKTHQEAIAAITNIDYKGKVHHVKITCKRGKRSIDQNSYYWLILNALEQETGNSKEDLHDYFRTEYLGIELCNVLGRDYERIRSTTVLDTAQFTQYIEKISVFASSELGFAIPDPKDLEFERFKDYYSKFL